MKIKIAILGSTRGSNLEPLFNLLKEQQLAAEIVLVISDREHAVILERAKNLKITTEFISAATLSRDAYGEKLTTILKKYNIDLIILMGFMRILAASFTQQWVQKIINVHPSLLPKYAGLMDLQVHAAVLAAGDKESGCTVHLVEEEVDAGKIIVQKKCEIVADETCESLKAKVQKLEVMALFEAIKEKL